MLNKGLKIMAYIIDVVAFPLRALLGFEVVITAAILSNESVKEAITIYWEQIKLYPKQLVEATGIIFGEEF